MAPTGDDLAPALSPEELATWRAEQKAKADAKAKAEADQAAADKQAKATEKAAAQEEAERVAAEAEQAENRKKNPDGYLGQEVGPGQVAYREHPGPVKDRVYRLDGQTWEHTHEDADGCWIYRQKP